MRSRKNKLHLFLIIAVMAVLIFSCSKKQIGNIQITKENGVTIVSNPVQPLFPRAKLIYEEELSIGQEEGDTNFVLYRVTSVRADEEGNIFVMNSGSYQVRVFDKNGKFIRAFGKKGQGPGEFVSNFLQFDTDGRGNVYVSDFQTRRIEKFSPEGELLQELNLKEKFPRTFSVTQNGDVCCSFPDYEKSSKERRVLFQRIDFTGKVLTDFGTVPDFKMKPIRSGKQSVIIMTGMERGPEWEYDKNGFFYFGTKDKYEISVSSPENRLLRIIRHKWTPIKVTSADKEKIRESYKNFPMDVSDKIEIPDEKQSFEKFFIDDRQYFWIKSPVRFGTEGSTFDVFNPEGKYFYRVNLPFKPSYIKNGKIYTHESNEDGVEIVKRYGYRWEK